GIKVMRLSTYLPRIQAPGDWMIGSSDSDSLKLRVSLKQDGNVFIAQNQFPGWRATVNGRPQEILTANHSFQAVALKAGNYDIELGYEPAFYTLSMILSAAAFVIIMI